LEVLFVPAAGDVKGDKRGSGVLSRRMKSGRSTYTATLARVRERLDLDDRGLMLSVNVWQ